VRDKDAVTATLLACEIASCFKSEGSSIYQELINLYITNGFYKEQLVSFVKEGKDGAAEIYKMMSNYREQPLKQLIGSKVKYFYDYESSTKVDLQTQEVSKIELPKSNVLIFETIDGTKVAIRPSGTEPKIKFYMSVKEKLSNIKEYNKIDSLLSKKIEQICKEMKLTK